MLTCYFENGGQASLRHTTVDTIVQREGRILLVKRSQKLREGGKWALPGGFMDRGETAAQGAAREAYEETGWEIEGLTLLTINDNPDRPAEDYQNISFVFIARGTRLSGEKDWESDEVRWFPLDELPPRGEIAFDHAANIDLYKKYLSENFALPFLR